MRRFYILALIIALRSFGVAQDATLRGRVDVLHSSKRESGNAEVVIWLTPAQPIAPAHVNGVRLVQKNKRFTPHVVAVTAGSEVEFPNQDSFFHDVFSIYRGKPFDLGLYESGTSRKVRFSQPGVSYIFCNIHPEMSATVIVLTTPYFAITARDGSFQVNHLTPGHYRMEVWYEQASDSELAALARDVEIVSGDNTPAVLTLHSSDAPKDHVNKYGQQYSPDKPKSY
jgi:plastocyanin